MKNYENMPLNGKVSVDDPLRYIWYNEPRRYKRECHKHYDLYKNWRKDATIGVAWPYLGESPSKGHKPKTWKDYK